MPAVMPARVMRSAVALATAARHMDDDGGREKLIELIEGITTTDLAITALCLARITGIQNSDESLQVLGMQCLEDKVVML